MQRCVITILIRINFDETVPRDSFVSVRYSSCVYFSRILETVSNSRFVFLSLHLQISYWRGDKARSLPPGVFSKPRPPKERRLSGFNSRIAVPVGTLPPVGRKTVGLPFQFAPPG